MEFREFKAIQQKHVAEILKDATHLFEVGLDKDKMWDVYLESFLPEYNKVFRERREHDCSCCRHFIKNIGNAVVIKDNKIITIWDFETNSEEYQPSVNAMSKYIKSQVVSDIYVAKDKKIGTDKNFEKSADGKITEWQHFFLELPLKFVDSSGKSEGDIKGGFRDTRNVFKRSLEEITEESLLTVLELISQNSLHRGKEWEAVLKEFLKHKKKYAQVLEAEAKILIKINGYKKEYAELEAKLKENYTWEQSVKVGEVVGRLKNHSIGTLLINISEGMDLDIAVGKFEFIVGDGYKRSTPVHSKKQLEDAKKTIIELGYEDSIKGRRFANPDDITVNNILFSNKDSAKRIKGDIFDEMLSSIPINPKKFSKVEEVSIENFINDILPTAKELELFLENKHSINMASLIAPESLDHKTMFKWNNNFSWSYSGNITDSTMKERVKSAGGNVEGVLRFSIQWNDNEFDGNDLDAHCIEPGGYEIFFSNKRKLSPTGGMLDVDIINPRRDTPAVENITWLSTSKMKKGVYKFIVHNYSNNGGRGGFRAEIEFNGQIYSFDYNKALRQSENILVAEVAFDKDKGFTIAEKLPSNVSSKEIWNLKTNQFVPVSVVCLSPNYWDSQNSQGNLHYMFMLKDCCNPENPNAFYVEFLKQELVPHRKFFEALGAKMALKDTEDQLSGVSFSSTKRNEVLVKIKGTVERMVKIKF